MSVQNRTTGWALFAVAGFIALVVALNRTPVEPVVFAMSIQTSDGSVLASPVVVGEAGKSVAVRMVCEDAPGQERMSLVLEPMSSTDGQILYSYELSVPGQIPMSRGTVSLSPGAEKSIQVRPNDPKGGVMLSLFTAPLKHPGIERYLKLRKARISAIAS